MPDYSALSETTRSILRKVSTATLCTALFKRGLRNQFLQNVQPLGRSGENMVGQAYTLRYIPAREDLNGIAVFENPEHPQRKAVEECPPGGVMVIDSRKDARAASAGGILVTRLFRRGVAGIVTDGGFRDSADIAALPFASYHNRPSAPTNLTLHQAVDINVPIACGDVAVWPGDVMVGDADGVVAIPLGIADEIAREAERMTGYEDYVLAQVDAGARVIGLYPLVDPLQKQAYESRLIK